MRVLVLEDDDRTSTRWCGRLRAEGMAVDGVDSLQDAHAVIDEVDYDCLVLDRAVSEADPLDLVVELSGRPSAPPALVVSATGTCEECLEGLEAGADDYLARPVLVDELALRVRRVALRHSSDPTRGLIELGRVAIDRCRRWATIDGAEVTLTRTQYSVLEYLVTNRDRLVEIEELLEHCWDNRRDLFSNPLHSQITRLRKVFRGALRFDCVHGRGYVVVPVPSELPDVD